MSQNIDTPTDRDAEPDAWPALPEAIPPRMTRLAEDRARREAEIERREGKTDPMTLGRAVAYGLMAVLIIVFSGQAPVPFVYFQI